MCLCPWGGGEKFLLKTEKKIQELQEYIYLATLNSENLNFLLTFLDTSLKGQPQGVYIGHRMILVQPNFNNPINTASEKEENSSLI